jgi:hypothetical protein
MRGATWHCVGGCPMETLLKVVENKIFRQQKVTLDGYMFSKCVFVQCEIVYSGGYYETHECELSPGCRWAFEDAANRTLEMIRTLCDTNSELRSQLFPNWQSWVRDNPTIQ